MKIRGNIYYKGKFEKRTVEIEKGRISSFSESKAELDFGNDIVVPGFIDSHIHGCNGSDVMDMSSKSFEIIREFCFSRGVTTPVYTTLSASYNDLKKVVEESKKCDFEVLIHLEGPYINPLKKGAQNEKYIRKPDIAEIKELQRLAEGRIKLITFAPETDINFEFSAQLKKLGIVPSIGHTNADAQMIQRAHESEIKRFTHYCNAMNGLHHREIGAVGAAMLFDDTIIEIIADGYHLSPDAVKLFYKVFSNSRIIGITDSMRATGLKNGTYDLGGLQVNVSDGKATLENGTIAGSTLTMDSSLRNVLKFTGTSVEKAIRLYTSNPARNIGLKDRGSIACGKLADLVVLDKEYRVKTVIKTGKVVYSN